MERSASLVIIHHENSPPDRARHYLLSMLAEGWRRQGLAVRHVYGTAKEVPADVAILHVDLSVVPPEYAAFARRYPTTLNLRALDIRKRRFSRLIVSDPDAYEGAVIVKTDLNAGGGPERLLRRRAGARPIALTWRALGRLAEVLGLSPTRPRTSWLSWQLRYGVPAYRVYRTGREVPARYRRDPRWIVERFAPERRGRHYWHRRYFFLGDAEVNEAWVAEEAVCSGDDYGEVQAEPVPRELREFRRDFGIQFGKIDYVLAPSGEVVVLDVNKTPWGACSHLDDAPWLEQLCERLSPGIDDFLRPTAADTALAVSACT